MTSVQVQDLWIPVRFVLNPLECRRRPQYQYIEDRCHHPFLVVGPLQAKRCHGLGTDPG